MGIQNVSSAVLQAIVIYLIPEDRYPKRSLPPLLRRCAPARESKLFSYKLEIFSDGYVSPKFIPHEIFLTEIFKRTKNNGIVVSLYIGH